MGNPSREGDFFLLADATWRPATATTLDLGPASELERFAGVSLSASLTGDSDGIAAGISVRGERPSSCAEPLDDGTCPDWESLARAELNR